MAKKIKLNQNVQYNRHGQPFYALNKETFQDKAYVEQGLKFILETDDASKFRVHACNNEVIAISAGNDAKKCRLLLEQIQWKNRVELRLTACGAFVHDRNEVYAYLETFHNNFFSL